MKEDNYKTIQNEYIKFFDAKKLYDNLDSFCFIFSNI